MRSGKQASNTGSVHLLTGTVLVHDSITRLLTAFNTFLSNGDYADICFQITPRAVAAAAAAASYTREVVTLAYIGHMLWRSLLARDRYRPILHDAP